MHTASFELQQDRCSDVCKKNPKSNSGMHWPDKYEDIPQLHRRHLPSQLKQGAYMSPRANEGQNRHIQNTVADFITK